MAPDAADPSLQVLSGPAWEAFSRVSEIPAVAFDPSSSECLIASSTAGFTALTGYTHADLHSSTRNILLNGIADAMISRSAKKNFLAFCGTSLLSGVGTLGETCAAHAFGRSDGTSFTAFETLGFCVVQQQPYVISVHIKLCEGPIAPRLTAEMTSELKEQARHSLARLRHLLQFEEVPRPLLENSVKGWSFFDAQLQDHCILFNGGCSVARREPEELPLGCMLYGTAPMRPTEEGLRFALRVDGVTGAFGGLPLLGFTRRRPVDNTQLYPSVSRCLGRSVLVGASGEAFARDQEEHFKVGFRKIPDSEVASWSTDPGVPVHRRKAPIQLQVGDIIECRYTWQGQLQFLLNGAVLLDFNVERPLEAADYWPVVDVAHSVTAVSSVILEPAAASPRRRKSVTLSDISTDDESPVDSRDVDDWELEDSEDWLHSHFVDIGVNGGLFVCQDEIASDWALRHTGLVQASCLAERRPWACSWLAGAAGLVLATTAGLALRWRHRS